MYLSGCEAVGFSLLKRKVNIQNLSFASRVIISKQYKLIEYIISEKINQHKRS